MQYNSVGHVILKCQHEQLYSRKNTPITLHKLINHLWQFQIHHAFVPHARKIQIMPKEAVTLIFPYACECQQYASYKQC